MINHIVANKTKHTSPAPTNEDDRDIQSHDEASYILINEDDRYIQSHDEASYILISEAESFDGQYKEEEFADNTGTARPMNKKGEKINWGLQIFLGFLGLSAMTSLTKSMMDSGFTTSFGKIDGPNNHRGTDTTASTTAIQDRFLNTLLTHTRDSLQDLQFADIGIANVTPDVSTLSFSDPEHEPSDGMNIQDITHEQLQELLQIIEQTELAEEELVFGFTPTHRSKRAFSKNEQLRFTIDQKLWGMKDFFTTAPAFQEALENVYHHSQREAGHIYDKNPHTTPYVVVEIYLKTLSQAISKLNDKNNYLESGNFDAMYRDIYSVLRLTWKILEEETDPNLISKMVKLKNYFFQRDILKTSELSDLTTPNVCDEVRFYLTTHYLNLDKAHLRRNDVFVLSTESRIERFSLLDLLEGKHREFMTQPGLKIHRLSNYAAFPEPEIEAFVKDVSKEEFSRFLRSTQFADFIESMAHQLLNAGLDKLEGPDRYINKNLWQQDKYNTLKTSPVLTTEVANQALLRKMAEIIDTRPQPHHLESITLLFAISALTRLKPYLFKDLDKNQVILSSYAYSYNTPEGDTLFDSAMLEEILFKDILESGFAIARRDNVQIHYPPEFPQKLHNALDALTKIVSAYYQDTRLNILTQRLNKVLPTFKEQLEEELRTICERVNIDNCDLSEKIKFKINKVQDDSEEITLTVGQILIGDLRRIIAKYYFHKPDITEFSDAPPLKSEQEYLSALNMHLTQGNNSTYTPENINILSYKYQLDIQKNRPELYANYVKELNSSNLLDQIKNQLTELANNPEIIGQFDDYVNTLKNNLKKKANITIHDTGEILNTPLIRIYFINKPIWRRPDDKLDYRLDRNNDHYPLYLQSLISGQTIKFNSFSDLRWEANNGEEFHQFIASHSYMDYRNGTTELDIVPLTSEDSWKHVMEFRLKNTDKTIMSPGQAKTYRSLEVIYDYREVITAPLLLAGGLWQSIAELIISGAVPQYQKFVATRTSEHEQLNRQSIKNVVSDVAGAIVGKKGADGTEYVAKIIAKAPIVKKLLTSAAAEKSESLLAGLEKFRNVILAPGQTQQILDKGWNFVKSIKNSDLLRKVPHGKKFTSSIVYFPADQFFEKNTDGPFDNAWELFIGSYPEVDYTEIIRYAYTTTNQLDLSGNIGAEKFEADKTKLNKGTVIE
jgi:hypothetical protein